MLEQLLGIVHVILKLLLTILELLFECVNSLGVVCIVSGEFDVLAFLEFEFSDLLFKTLNKTPYNGLKLIHLIRILLLRQLYSPALLDFANQIVIHVCINLRLPS